MNTSSVSIGQSAAADTRPLGVLLMAYGTPGSLDEVEGYYTDIRRGRKPTPELLAELVDRYTAVGGATPLLDISRSQAHALQTSLGPGFHVFLGMKHWHPYIRQAVAEMQELGISRAVGLVLAPHYSRGSIGEYKDRVDSARAELEADVEVSVVSSWHLNAHYLDALAEHVQAGLRAFSDAEAPVTVVFTAHSLPERVVTDGDPYQDQLLQTSEAVAERVGVPGNRWSFSFQSAGRTPDPWLGPDLLTTIARLDDERVRRILVAPIGFISDHLEILYDIDLEARNEARARGIELRRIESLNDDPKLIAALTSEVLKAAGSLKAAATGA